MAFLKNSFLEYNCERFNFLYLDPGEIYFESFGIVVYNQESFTKLTINYKGYLRLCSKSIIFEPDDIKYPLYKVLFKNCNVLDKWQKGTTLFSRQDYSNILMIQSKLVSLIPSNCKNEPYKTIKGNHKFIFCLTYSKVDDFLPFVQQLIRSTTLNPADQSLMVNAIVESRLIRAPFDMNWLDDLLLEEIKLIMEANRVLPLVIVPGRIILTAQKLYYQPLHNLNQFLLKTYFGGLLWLDSPSISVVIGHKPTLNILPPDFKLNLSLVSDIWERRFKLKPIGLELRCNSEANNLIPSSSNRHIYLSFGSQVKRDAFISIFTNMESVKVKQNENREVKLANLTQSWVQGVISNFDYLLHLNNLADRSFNDLTQYPVFPWVLSDYTSSSIDLNDERVYRDLSKPIGALNPERLKRLKTRLNEMLEDGSRGAHGDEIFLYGSHYSTPGFVLYYLVRSAPQHALSLHGGRFDHADRVFHSIAETWSNVLTSASDFKELIPEFYMVPGGETDATSNFLLNHLNLNLGVRHDGTHINHVVLPPWAYDLQTSGYKGNTPMPIADACAKFFKTMRAALESDIVSRSLPHWIDLIFGYRQNGASAMQADNLFHPLTYEQGNCMMKTSDPFYADECNAHYVDENRRRQCETQVLEFGQTPRQLFFDAPHPPKITALLGPLRDLVLGEVKDNNGIEKGQENTPSRGGSVLKVPEVMKQLEYEQYHISPADPAFDDICYSYKIKAIKSRSTLQSPISSDEWVILSAFKNTQTNTPKFSGLFLGQRGAQSTLVNSIYYCSTLRGEGSCHRFWPAQEQANSSITALATNNRDNVFIVASGHSNGTYCVSEFICTSDGLETIITNFTISNAHEIHCDVTSIAILPAPPSQDQRPCLIATSASDYRLKLWYRCPANAQAHVYNNYDFKYGILTELDTDSVVHRLSLAWLPPCGPASGPLWSAEFLCTFGNGADWETHRYHLGIIECSKRSSSSFGPTLNMVCQNSSGNVFTSSTTQPFVADSFDAQFFTYNHDNCAPNISFDQRLKPQREIGRLIENDNYLATLIVLNKLRGCLAYETPNFRVTFSDFSRDLSVESTRVIDNVTNAICGEVLVDTENIDHNWGEISTKDIKTKPRQTELHNLDNCYLCENILLVGTRDGQLICYNVVNTSLCSRIKICSSRIVSLIVVALNPALVLDLLVTDETGCIYVFTLDTIKV